MKTLLITTVIVAFASLTSVQAGDAKTCPDAAKAAKVASCGSCCPSAKTTVATADSQAKGATQLMAKR